MKIKPHLQEVLVVVMVAMCSAGCSPNSVSLTVTSIENPANKGARLPNVARTNDAIVLSWVELAATQTAALPTHELKMATLDLQQNWSTPFVIARGDNWFLNWADFPSVYALSDKRLAAHWLQRSGDGKYAYDVVTRTSDDGTHWSPPIIPHIDQTQTEHGFASFFQQNNKTAIAWLDGRNLSTSNSKGDDHSGHADHSDSTSSSHMTLRSRVLPADSESLSEPSTLLDERVCDCCQTTAVNTQEGAIVFYRDRSIDEIRDIAYVRYDQATAGWSEPQTLAQDNWKITGCPVNGPSADAADNVVVVTWFTAVPTPRVQISISNNNGLTFSEPVVVSDQRALGRVTVSVLNEERVVVGWMEHLDDDVSNPSGVLKVRLMDTALAPLADHDVAVVSAERRSGFARMQSISENQAVIAWTQWDGQTQSIGTAMIRTNR